MTKLACESCGAPLDVKPEDAAAGTCTCSFCGTVMQLPRDEPAAPGAWSAALRTRFQDALDAGVGASAKKPAGCGIQLTQTPGIEFHAEIRGNRADVGTVVGVLVGGLVGGVGGGVWPTLGLAAASTHGVLSLVLWALAIGITVIAVVAAAIWLAYRIAGVEIIDARDGALTVRKRALALSRRKVYPWEKILAVAHESTGWSVNNVPTTGVYLKLANQRRARIASRSEPDEQPWLVHELSTFFAPIVAKRGGQ
jgi:hypothetical protein